VVTVVDLDREAVAKMIQVDLSALESEPGSPVGNFTFHGCTGGVAAFRVVHRGSFTGKATNYCSSWQDRPS
jgi:hypothetical protein